MRSCTKIAKAITKAIYILWRKCLVRTSARQKHTHTNQYVSGNADGHITTWGWSVANVQVRQPGGSKDEEDGAEKVGEEGMVDAQIMEL